MGNHLSLSADHVARARDTADSAKVLGTAGASVWQTEQLSCGAPALLTLRDVSHITKMSRSSLYNMLAANEFVRPFKMGRRSIRFLDSEVRAWIEERVAQRDAKEQSL
ncbi:hypothetical protein GmRootV118_02870 [Variovorax sp. V118]